jgi:hypothetical protein
LKKTRETLKSFLAIEVKGREGRGEAEGNAQNSKLNAPPNSECTLR